MPPPPNSFPESPAPLVFAGFPENGADLGETVARHRMENFLLGSGVGLPEAVRTASARRTATRSMEGLRQVKEIADLLVFARGGAHRVVFLKGQTLSCRLYGGAGRRPSRDIDLIVPEDGVALWDAHLAKSGYRRTRPRAGFDPVRLARYRRGRSQFEYVAKGRPLLELHWRLGDTYPEALGGFERAWEHCALQTIGTLRIPVLEDDFNFLFLAVHGAHHRWGRLYWLADLAEFLRQSPGIAERALALARSTFERRAIFLGLLMAHEQFAAPVEVFLLKDARRDGRVMSLVQRSRAAIAAPYTGNSGSRGYHLARYWRLLGMPWSGIFRFFSFSESDLENVRMPAGWGLLYFIIRPLGYVWRWAKRRGRSG